MAVNELERYNEILKRLDQIHRATLLASKTIYNGREAAMYLGVCTETLSSLIRSGYIKVHRHTNIMYYIEKEELDRFMLSDEPVLSWYKRKKLSE